jgi:hypothetical protein
MSRIQRALVVLGALVVMTPVAELTREKIVYDRFSTKLANASGSLQPGADKHGIKQVVGEPESVIVAVPYLADPPVSPLTRSGCEQYYSPA